MRRILSDLSQLTKAMIKPKDEPKPIPAPGASRHEADFWAQLLEATVRERARDAGEGDISDFRADLNSATEIANRCF